MTPQQRRALDRLQRQARTLAPELVAAILAAFKLIRERMPMAEVERLIRAGRITEVVNAAAPADLIERALNPSTQALTQGVLRSARQTIPLLPARARDIIVGFNELNPNIIDAIRALDTATIRTLVPEMQTAIRQSVEAGIRDGINPRAMARELRETIGLAPNQSEAVRNFRRKLEGGPRAAVYKDALDSPLRDRRFDSVVRRAMANGEKLTPAQIDRMVSAYQRRFIARNAETHARTAALDAQKVGQQLAWEESKASGALGDAEVIAVWVTNLDGRERPEHNAANGITRPLDGVYSTGQSYPGEGEWNCRCSEIFRVVKPSFALAA
jgi:hypothetical protein